MFYESIARRYALGLLTAAGTHQEGLGQELNELSKIFEDDQSGFKSLLVNPAFSPAERIAVIEKLALAEQMPSVLRDFLKLLVAKGRMKILPAISAAYARLLDEKQGRIKAKITSAFPLSTDASQEICDLLAKLTKRQVIAEQAVEPKLLGGVKIEMAGAVIDGSLSSKVQALTADLMDLRL
jgi:F-type H+-transporting ATPase subunit delta